MPFSATWSLSHARQVLPYRGLLEDCRDQQGTHVAKAVRVKAIASKLHKRNILNDADQFSFQTSQRICLCESARNSSCIIRQPLEPLLVGLLLLSRSWARSVASFLGCCEAGSIDAGQWAERDGLIDLSVLSNNLGRSRPSSLATADLCCGSI
jgi:hypothetical protein